MHRWLIQRLAKDLANASREEEELNAEIKHLQSEVEAERMIQAAAKERIAILSAGQEVCSALL